MFVDMKLQCPRCAIKYTRETQVHDGFSGPILLMVRCPRCSQSDVFEYRVKDSKIEILEERSQRVLELRERIGLAP